MDLLGRLRVHGGHSALVLGLVARFTSRPFDTPGCQRAFSILLGIVALDGIVASALSYNLASNAGAWDSLKLSSLVGPVASGIVIYVWTAGFPVSRLFNRRT